MKIDVLTLFPQMFLSLNHSIVGKAQKMGAFDLQCHHLRDFATDSYGKVDDTPYGGEAGMVLKPDVLATGIRSIWGAKKEHHTIFLTPQAKIFTQNRAKRLSKHKKILIICGHYKGIDQRICEKYVDEELSIGDFVLTGGELPAMVIIDSLVRLLPQVVGNASSVKTDSFYEVQKLGWPVYTRPEVFEDMVVPKELLSGHHKQIEEWREKQSLKQTQQKRPDLYQKLEQDLVEKE